MIVSKRALIVGLDHYDHFNRLNGCIADAREMETALARHADEAVNFDCRLLTSSGPERVTRVLLRRRWDELFDSFTGDIAFYFAGHGAPTEVGGYLVTQEGEPGDYGLPMNDLVLMANNSRANSVLIILDCCFSGLAGNNPGPQGGGLNEARLREGVTILAASRPTQTAGEVDGHGIFTDLVLGALLGGAADVRGQVSAAAVYGYVESAIGPWGQRPLYKSHAAHLDPVRRCHPKVHDALLRALPTFFPTPDHAYRLDMTYEETNGAAVHAHVEVFRKFKTLQVAGLLKPKVGEDLYWTAERSGTVVLTELGQFYRRLRLERRI